MKFNLTIEMDNAAFDPDGGGQESGTEVAAILEKVAFLTDGVVLSEGHDGVLFDANGARVGTWAVTDE